MYEVYAVIYDNDQDVFFPYVVDDGAWKVNTFSSFEEADRKCQRLNNFSGRPRSKFLRFEVREVE